MSIGDTTLTVVGNLTKDPEVRFLDSGAAVASLTIASSRRVFDQKSGEWKDGDTIFMYCSAWRHLAEHIGDSLTRGMRVVATGRLKQREYTDNKGIQRTVMELEIEDIGVSLKYATATATKAARTGRIPHPADQSANRNTGDAWATASGSGWDSAPAMAGGPGYGDEPPF
jgi:single-strand DNA-binding protein